MIERIKSVQFNVIIFIAIVIALGLSSIEVNAELNNNEKINYLIEKGATREILERLPQDKIDEFYSKVSDENLMCKTYSQTVIKEIPSDSKERGAIESSEIVLKCSGDFFVNAKNQIYWAVINYSGKWEKGKPLIWGKDGVTFNWDSNKFACDFTEFYSEYYKDGGNVYTAYSIDNPVIAAIRGIAYSVDLARFDGYSQGKQPEGIQNRGFFGVVEFVPNETVYAGKGNYFATVLNYAHNKNPLPIELSFSILGVNVAIDSDALVDTIGQNFTLELIE